MKESFEAKIASGKKIEPFDDIPDDYRQVALKIIKFHTFSEVIGPLTEAEYLDKVPTLYRKQLATAKVQDEEGHGQILLSVTESLGPTREELMDELLSGKGKYLHIFHYPVETWADVPIIGWLIDGAEIERQVTLQESSYGPYARCMKKLVYEEAFHYRQGLDAIEAMMNGTDAQRKMVQESLNRFWERILLMFGPHDSDSSPNAEIAMYYRLKVRKNDELRDSYLRMFIPRIKRYGLEIPDPKLHFDETKKRWIYTDPDWDELKRINRMEMPDHLRRVEIYRNHYYGTQWVRDALTEYNQEKREVS